jgi:hypothetical protein
MTISGEVKQTLASLKGVSATLVSFASIEENPEAKAVLCRNMQRINGVIKDLDERVRVLEFEEPQYKGF